ncbi:MAG: hypothetical protein FWD88_00110, partial [Treponema sp.]|nr:hypothetical protein [Treponema sp.]
MFETVNPPLLPGTAAANPGHPQQQTQPNTDSYAKGKLNCSKYIDKINNICYKIKMELIGNSTENKMISLFLLEEIKSERW